MGRDWTTGSTRAWRRLRAQILTRDQHRCRLQLDGCRVIADCVHHLDGKLRGDDPDRLVASCTPCNLKVGEPTHHDPQPTPRTDWS